MMTIVIWLCYENKAEVLIKHLNNPLKQGNRAVFKRKTIQSNYSDLSALTDQLQQTIKRANHNTRQLRAQPSIIPGKHVRAARSRFW